MNTFTIGLAIFGTLIILVLVAGYIATKGISKGVRFEINSDSVSLLELLDKNRKKLKEFQQRNLETQQYHSYINTGEIGNRVTESGQKELHDIAQSCIDIKSGEVDLSTKVYDYTEKEFWLGQTDDSSDGTPMFECFKVEESDLQVGTQIELGAKYAEHSGRTAGEVIELVEGKFEHDNGLHTEEQYAPAIYNEDSKEYDSIFHLFGNNLENWMDCTIVGCTFKMDRFKLLPDGRTACKIKTKEDE
jgi:hypothetical protein